MKAKPVKLIYGQGYHDCALEECTHVAFRMPGPSGMMHLPVVLRGKREGTGCWTWNGDTERPTLRPSVLTQGHSFDPDNDLTNPFRCHTWINDGKAQFLDDCSHELRGQTVDLLDLENNQDVPGGGRPPSVGAS